MDRTRIIQQGDIAKFQVAIDREDYDQVRDDFWVTLRWGIPEQSITIQKSAMITDEEHHYFMVFDSASMLGKITAECHYILPDTDMSDGTRMEIDRQILGFVVNNGCPQFACRRLCVGQDVRHVTYTRAFRDDVNTLYLNLRDSQQRQITDSEGQNLRVRKSEEDLY